jgi:hypothetical protein
MNERNKIVLQLARGIQEAIGQAGMPPPEGFPCDSDSLIPTSLVRGTRRYIETIVNEINGCYERGWYNACAVMIRRLVETLIIEAYEHHSIADHITSQAGDFESLEVLIREVQKETAWNLARDAKRGLPRLKKLGDLAAHNRRYLCQRQYLVDIRDDLRVVSQELISLSGLRR